MASPETSLPVARLVMMMQVTGGDAINIPPRNDGGNGGGGGGNNGGANGEGGNSGAFKPEELDAQGIPYMCLAQCTEVGTSVGHKKVPPMPVCPLLWFLFFGVPSGGGAVCSHS